MNKTSQLLLGLSAILALNLYGCCRPIVEKTYDQVHYLDSMDILSRVEMEELLVKNDEYLHHGDSGCIYDLGFGQMYNGCRWDLKGEPPYHYGAAFFSDITEPKDTFLQVSFRSDHDYKNPNRYSIKFFSPKLSVCDQENSIKLLTLPDDSPNISDSLYGLKSFISIPILISRGLIRPAGQQKALCMTTSNDWIKGTLCNNVIKNWEFNTIRIEANEIEALMQKLADKGVTYEYPETPLY